ncbi:ribonuclease catalytic domain-containing protein [Nocardioides panacis]|uniref:ribonuclease catalytic domain-containing protein n=1 Tax=Nocardioides panacis TaxID=2849501 RepID=UPI003F56A3B3
MRVLHADGDTLRAGITAIQQDLGVHPEFPAEVEQAAQAAASSPRLPDLDRTDIPFVTIDPETSMDLDQALHIERDGTGYVVHYAIADVAAFVTPGDPVDEEANRRGETFYAADSKIPLHPKVLSEAAASLLPDQDRPALLWTIKVDADGEGTDVDVVRAVVRSRAKLDYAGIQKDLDAGTADELFVLLGEVGELRRKREAARGGVSLPLPEQEIDIDGERWSLTFRRMLPVEEWNAQISLLTGMAAASLMVYARVGLLRTLPPPDPRDLQRMHRTAKALHIEWPAELLYPDFIRSLHPEEPSHAAMIVASTRLLRGSGYVAFNGETPEQPEHSALASEYAHVTAPLRRLGDRYAGEVCLALCAGTEVPPVGARAARGAAPDVAGLGPPGTPVRARGARPGGGRRPAPQRRADLPGGRGAGRRRGPEAGRRGGAAARDRGARDLGRRAAAGHRRRGPPGPGRHRQQDRPLRALSTPRPGPK